jgi:hypothetical protein
MQAQRIDPATILDVPGFPPVNAHRHLLYMCTEIERMVAVGQREKAFRWLGFLQGSVWAFGMSDLAQLKAMNRPASGRGILDVG